MELESRRDKWIHIALDRVQATAADFCFRVVVVRKRSINSPNRFEQILALPWGWVETLIERLTSASKRR